jgi:hypothetical protein
MKPKYDTNHIIGTFGLVINAQCDHLDKLLTAPIKIPEPDIEILEKYRLRLQQQGTFWNEEELKMRFLAFLFDYVAIVEPQKIEIFFERTLSATLQQKKYTVICDCLFARPFGIYEPQIPYFFLQEFKKQKQAEDAEGQMLMAMLIAQANNNNEQPIYGCYIQGRYWVFATLHQQNYCISRTFEITQNNDYYAVISILKHLKYVILSAN